MRRFVAILALCALLVPTAALAADPAPAAPAPAVAEASAPLAKGDKAPFDGILISEQRAAAALKLRIDFDRVSADCQVDRRVASEKERILRTALDEVQTRAERSWWERHQGGIMFTGGVAVGVGLSVAILKALVAAGVK